MSLINQMLRDLEKRSSLNTSSSFEPVENPDDANNQAANVGAMAIEDAEVKKDKNRPSAFLIISLTFLVVYLAMYYWFTVDNVTPIPRDDLLLADNTAPSVVSPKKQPVVVDTDAVVAEIAAAIEAKIRDTHGDVDSEHIQAMVEKARKTKSSKNKVGEIVKPSEVEIAAIAEYDTLNEMHMAAEAAEAAKKPATNVEASVQRVEIVATKPAPTEPTPTKPSKIDPFETVAAKKTAPSVAKAGKEASTTAELPVTSAGEKLANLTAPIKLPVPAPPVKTTTRPAKPSLASLPKASNTVASHYAGKPSFVKHVRPQQESEQQYQKALDYVQQGRVSEAQNILATAIKTYPKNHDARQTLAALLLDNNRIQDASTVLKDGLKSSPEHIAFRMAAARLDLELSDQPEALRTLLSGVSFAHNNAEYHAFLATLLQRNHQHKEAVKHYQTALNIDRGMSNAFVGLGISLQALGNLEEARVAYSSAKKNQSLNQNIRSFVDYRLKEVETRISAR